MWETATHFWDDESRVTCLLGSLMDIGTVPWVWPDLPVPFDLVLLDGGAQGGLAEAQLAAPHTTLLALDDTNVAKHQQTIEWLKQQGWQWQCGDEERNGWAIFKHP